MRDNSPPETIRASGRGSSPALGERKNCAASIPLAVHDGSGSVMTRYGVTGLPETWTLDRRGRLVDHIPGVTDAGRLDRAIERARRS